MHPHNLFETQDEHVHVKDQKTCKLQKLDIDNKVKKHFTIK